MCIIYVFLDDEFDVQSRTDARLIAISTEPSRSGIKKKFKYRHWMYATVNFCSR